MLFRSGFVWLMLAGKAYETDEVAKFYASCVISS